MSRLAALLAGRVRLGVQAGGWEEAVRAAADVLTAAGDVTASYGDAMVRTVREIGPYIVVAPGVALPHARPEDGVVRTCVGMVRLARPVPFGNEANDPVDLVFPFGTRDHEEHIEMLAELARFLSDPERVARLREARTVEKVLAVLRRGAPAEG